MKRIEQILLGAAVAALMGEPASAQSKFSAAEAVAAITQRSPSLSAHAEQEFFKRYYVEYFRAWSPGDSAFDINQAAPFYRHDNRLTAFDIFPPVSGFTGWTAYAAGLSATMAATALFDIVPDPASFHYERNGNVVWMSMLFQAKGRLKSGAPIDVPGRNTLVLERQGARWLIVHEHISTPMGG